MQTSQKHSSTYVYQFSFFANDAVYDDDANTECDDNSMHTCKVACSKNAKRDAAVCYGTVLSLHPVDTD